MSLRTSLIGVGVAGALVTGLVVGLAQAHDGSPPALGDTIEVTPSSGSDRAERPLASQEAGATPAPPGPAPSAEPTGGRAVAPPPVPPEDADDGSRDDGADDGADDADDGAETGDDDDDG